MQIGLIGAGNMARALARGWGRALLCSDPVAQRARALALEVGGEALASNAEGIADFYFDRGEYEAAAERYRALLNEYPGLGFDPRVLFKLGECYAELQRDDEADRIFRTLIAQYADSEFATRARHQMATNLP